MIDRLGLNQNFTDFLLFLNEDKKVKIIVVLVFTKKKTRQHLWYKKVAELKWAQQQKMEKKVEWKALAVIGFFVSFHFFVSKCDSPRIQSMVPINGAFSPHLLFLSFCLFFFLFSLCLLMRKMKEENGFLEQYSTYVCLSRKVQRGRLIWDWIERERQKAYFSTLVLLTISFKSFEVVVSLRTNERTNVA